MHGAGSIFVFTTVSPLFALPRGTGPKVQPYETCAARADCRPLCQRCNSTRPLRRTQWLHTVPLFSIDSPTAQCHARLD